MLENRLAAIAAPSISRTRVDELPSRQRARRTNDPLAEIGTNTARGRRVADLVRAYLRALGNPANINNRPQSSLRLNCGYSPRRPVVLP